MAAQNQTWRNLRWVVATGCGLVMVVALAAIWQNANLPPLAAWTTVATDEETPEPQAADPYVSAPAREPAFDEADAESLPDWAVNAAPADEVIDEESTVPETPTAPVPETPVPEAAPSAPADPVAPAEPAPAKSPRTESVGESPAPPTTVSKTAPATPAVVDLAEVDRLLAAGKHEAALQMLSDWYWKLPAERATFQAKLDETAQRIYFGPQPHVIDPYVIQPGDQLRKIAVKYSLSWQYLAKLNKVDPKRIRAGQKLKVHQGPFAILVDLSDFELTVHQNGRFVKRYKVGIGKDGSTPLGEFTVQNKLEDPTYYGPDGVIAHDDPLNPLGERWIDIGDSYGIHGTINPRSIGKSESKGCLRLLNSEAEEVYDLTTIGTKVVIQP